MYDKFEARHAMLAWRYQHHRKRLERFIEAMPRKLICQACGGSGEFEVDCTEWGPIYNDCGWCEGIGYMTPFARGLLLRVIKAA